MLEEIMPSCNGKQELSRFTACSDETHIFKKACTNLCTIYSNGDCQNGQKKCFPLSFKLFRKEKLSAPNQSAS